MQPQEPIVQDLFDQHDGAIGELLFVAHVRDDHPYGDRIVEREPCGDIHRYDHLESEDRIVYGFEAYFRPPEPDIRVDEIGVAIEPLALALVLGVEKLEALYRAHALDECRVLLGLVLYDLVVAPPKDPKQAHAKHPVKEKGGETD